MVQREDYATLEDLQQQQAHQPDALLELIHGAIIAKVTSEEHGRIVINIGAELRQWLRDTPGVEGHYSTEASVRIPGDEVNERRPDVSFRRTSDALSTEASLSQMPDFIVDVKSPHNSYDFLREKARYYLANGARLVWLVYPRKRIVEVYVAEGASELYTEGDTLSGGDVLPGFALRVGALFA